MATGTARIKRLAQIPSVDSLLRTPEAGALLRTYPRASVADAIRRELESFRRRLLEEDLELDRAEMVSGVMKAVGETLAKAWRPSLRRAINATGVILHTGLGRAPLTSEARENLLAVTENYCTLEVDIESGRRGERGAHVEGLLCQLSGSEAAAVVNNNAAAVLLALNTLAFGREVIISRGQLIEIGGSFRMPEVMAKSGAIMVEVGTTNRTHLADYAQAINEHTGAILAVHCSNYRILGFTAEVSIGDLVKLGREKNVPVIHDLGGGVLIDLRQFGLPYEPVVRESLQAGAEVVTFSGDKVLGGPQAGILVGKRSYLEAIKRNPLMRALRCDKLTYAALESTLRLFLNEDELPKKHPVLRMFTDSIETIEARARQLLGLLRPELKQQYRIGLEDSVSQVGSGALPLEEIPSKAVTVASSERSCEDIAARLRRFDPPIFSYIRDDKCFLDLRAVSDPEVTVVAEALNGLVGDETK